jgi:hypothetical protein
MFYRRGINAERAGNAMGRQAIRARAWACFYLLMGLATVRLDSILRPLWFR